MAHVERIENVVLSSVTFKESSAGRRGEEEVQDIVGKGKVVLVNRKHMRDGTWSGG